MAEEPGQPITGLRSGDVSPYAFVCGDPARVERIAAGWKSVREVCNLREYRIVVGENEGVRLTAASTGIGAPSTAILVEELAKIGVETFIRVGNSGGLAPDLEVGDLVITSGAVRDDGTSRSYVPPEYPAVASYDVVAALVEAAKTSGARFRTGITWSLDAFYARNAILAPDGSLKPMTFDGYWPAELPEKIRALQHARVLNCEMESGVLLTLAGLYGLRAGAICVVSDRTPWPGPAEIEIDNNMDVCIEIARAAMLRLASG
jgi:uridine phosphorylase